MCIFTISSAGVISELNACAKFEAAGMISFISSFFIPKVAPAFIACATSRLLNLVAPPTCFANFLYSFKSVPKPPVLAEAPRNS